VMETGPLAVTPECAEAVRLWFREDPSRMTMMAARKFGLPEQSVVDSLVGQWPITRLREGTFSELMDALPALGTMRVFVRSKAAIIESVGVFGGYSEAGPFFNVQTDTLDMHIFPAEIASIYAVVKRGHDSEYLTHSFQFFDRQGDAGFKAFLWENYPDVPATCIDKFHELNNRLASPSIPALKGL
jgi:putative hemin transport protein